MNKAQVAGDDRGPIVAISLFGSSRRSDVTAWNRFLTHQFYFYFYWTMILFKQRCYDASRLNMAQECFPLCMHPMPSYLNAFLSIHFLFKWYH